MADFRTHISFSTTLGIGYATAGYSYLDMPLTTSVLAGGLCGVAGMLPDLDSDSSVPLRETLALAAALAPMLLLDHFERWGLSHEGMALAAASIYIVVRFGFGEVLRRYTVHRGMWHSLPAAAIAGLLALMVCSEDVPPVRLFKAGAVLAGYLSHLVLDQLYGLRYTTRTSLGGPLKLWRKDAWSNGSTYIKLVLLLAWAASDPGLMEYFGWQDSMIHTLIRDVVQQMGSRSE